MTSWRACAEDWICDTKYVAEPARRLSIRDQTVRCGRASAEASDLRDKTRDPRRACAEALNLRWRVVVVEPARRLWMRSRIVRLLMVEEPARRLQIRDASAAQTIASSGRACAGAFNLRSIDRAPERTGRKSQRGGFRSAMRHSGGERASAEASDLRSSRRTGRAGAEALDLRQHHPFLNSQRGGFRSAIKAAVNRRASAEA